MFETLYGHKRPVVYPAYPGVGKFDLSPMIVNGVFSRYMDPDTDNAWIGFQLAKIFDARVQTGKIDPTKLE